MKIGIVGYQGVGKSKLFHWLTSVPPDLSLKYATQMATATVRDPRVKSLCEIYQPQKVTEAKISLIDTPGLNRDHEGSAGKLALIREAGCLVVVVGVFADAQPIADLQRFEEDLLIADLDIVTGRVERLRESVKKPRPSREKELEELQCLETILKQLEQGCLIRELTLDETQSRAIKSFQLLTNKPRLVVLNVSEVESQPDRFLQELPDSIPAVAFSIPLQCDLENMNPKERLEFCHEMGVQPYDKDMLLRQIMNSSRQMLFFTASEKEVRTWLIPMGASAQEAAGEIHTDLARGFVRAEAMTCDDLIRLGSEREVKAQNLMRRETKNYVVQDGDILHILSNS